MIRVVAAILVSTGVAYAAADDSASRDIVLPSGKTINVVSVERTYAFHFSPALQLTYMSDLSMNETEQVDAEVEGIWLSFRPDVERAGTRRATICAIERSQGPRIEGLRGCIFTFYQRADGTWAKVTSR